MNKDFEDLSAWVSSFEDPQWECGTNSVDFSVDGRWGEHYRKYITFNADFSWKSQYDSLDGVVSEDSGTWARPASGDWGELHPYLRALQSRVSDVRVPKTSGTTADNLGRATGFSNLRPRTLYFAALLLVFGALLGLLK